MIEPTVEMRRAAYDAMPPEVRITPAALDEVLAAVLALVERDRCMERRGHVWHPLARTWPSRRGGSHPHYCVSCSDGKAQGPGCINCRSTGMDQSPWPDCEQCRFARRAGAP